MKLPGRPLAAISPAALLVTALGLGGLVAWWLLSQPTAPHTGAAVVAAPAATGLPGSAADITAGGAAGLAAQVRPTDGASDSFLTPDLRHRLEALLLDAGEADTPTTLKRKLPGLVARHFSPAEAARATAMLERYVDYRVALGSVKAPTDPTDPRALRTALSARDAIRNQHFSPEEYHALFGTEEALDRYTLARLEVERNPALTSTQKTAALKDLEHDLSPDERAQRRQATVHLTVAAQTAALDAQGASDAERYRQRQAQHGDAAAQQLAQLDREERDWQARLGQYASAQAAKATPEALQQLRHQLFSPTEQMRLEGALALRNTSAANVATK